MEDFSLFPGSGACKPRKLCILSLAKILWRMLKKNSSLQEKTLQVCISFVPAGARRTIKERHGTFFLNQISLVTKCPWAKCWTPNYLWWFHYCLSVCDTQTAFTVSVFIQTVEFCSFVIVFTCNTHKWQSFYLLLKLLEFLDTFIRCRLRRDVCSEIFVCNTLFYTERATAFLFLSISLRLASLDLVLSRSDSCSI